MPSGRFAVIPIHPVDTAPVIDPAVLGDGTVLGTVEAARRLKCSKSHLYALMNRGELLFIQDGLGCRRRILLSSLLAYEAKHLNSWSGEASSVLVGSGRVGNVPPWCDGVLSGATRSGAVGHGMV